MKHMPCKYGREGKVEGRAMLDEYATTEKHKSLLQSKSKIKAHKSAIDDL